MKNTFVKLWNVLSWVLVVLVVLLAVALAGVRLLGLRPFAVLSGSMEPEYHVGSLVYVKKTAAADIRVGDVITFMMDENTVVTHRVTEIVPDESDADTLRFRTKGDGNDTEDGNLVHYKNVLGRVVFTLPYMGYVSNFIQKPPGMYIATAVVVLIFFAAFLPDALSTGPSGKHASPKKKK